MKFLSPPSLGGIVRGDADKTYRMISGVLRNTGSGWGWITDTGHAPSGFGAVTVSGNMLQIAHAVGGSKVSSLQVTPDETFAARGLRCGASVGVSSTNLLLYTGNPFLISDYVSFDGTNWSSLNGVYTGFSYNGAGVLTLTHESMGTDAASATLGPRGSAIYALGALTDTTTQVVFYTGGYGGTTGAASTGTAHTHPGPGLTAVGTMTAALSRVYVTRFGVRAVAPADPTTVVSANGNLWVTGLIEV